MKISFHGAAQTVTGSKHLITLNSGFKILLDCGMFQGMGRETQVMNSTLGFEAVGVDILVLSHAHIDHSGLIPKLYKDGFRGKIFATPATKDLAAVLLEDSAVIQRDDTKFINKRRARQGLPPFEALYDLEDAAEALTLFEVAAYDKWTNIAPGVELLLTDAGHIIGSASVHLKITENGETKQITFSGDIGRYNDAILRAPAVFPQANYIIIESTYGNKLHDEVHGTPDSLLSWIEKTCIHKKGKLIIPAFSIGRTQSLIYTLNRIFLKKGLTPVPIFVDSPLAQYATEVYRKHRNLLHPEAQAFYAHHGDEFEFENLTYTQNLKESKAITNFYEPCIIISSAGMLEGGRIQDHLYYNVQNLYCTLLFIGFCAPGTLGHKLLRGDSFVRIRDRELPVYATIEKTDLLSGHGDHADLMQVITQQKNLQKLFLVHGELSSMEELDQSASELGYETCIPKRGMQYTL